jgi:Zn-dependent protease
VVRDIADVAVATNLFLPAFGLLPIPGIDGGPILKWSLVERGASPMDADMTVRKVDGVLGAVLALVAAMAFKKRRFLLGALLMQTAALAWSIALGILREQE